MTKSSRALDRNLEALLKRAYVPVLAEPGFRDGLVKMARAEALRRRKSRPGGAWRWGLPLAAGAVAAGLLIWLGLRGPARTGEDGGPTTAERGREQVERGVAQPESGGPSDVREDARGVREELDSGFVAAGGGEESRRLVDGEAAAGAGAEPVVDELAAPELAQASVRGSVRTADGAPVPRFRVLMLLDRDVPEVEEPLLREFEGGSFAWEGLAPDSYEIFVESDGLAQYRTGPRPLAAGAPLELEVVLEPGRTVRGWVLGAETEAPLSGASVVIETEVPSRVLPFDLSRPPEWLTRFTSTASDGRFELAAVSDGPQLLRIDAEGFASAWVEVPAGDAPPADVFVRMEHGGGLEGVVRDANGLPIEGAVLLATLGADSAMARLFSYRQASTDAEGRYAFEELAPGFYMIVQWNTEAEAERGTPPNLQPVVVRPGEVAKLDFGEAPSAVRVHGRFRDARGEPARHKFTLLPQGSVNVSNATDWLASTSDSDGAYSVTVPKPDTYLVYLTFGMGERLSLVDEIVVPEGVAEHRHDVNLGTLAIRGRVTRADNGEPVGRAEVILIRLAGGGLFAGRALASPGGEYLFEGLRPAMYLVRASGGSGGEDLGDASTAPILLAAGAAEPVAADLSLPLGGTLEVSVVDAAGEAVARAAIELLDDNGRATWAGLEPYTRADGRMEIEGVPAGAYTVRASHEGYESAEARAEVRAGAGGSVVVELKADRSLEGEGQGQDQDQR